MLKKNNQKASEIALVSISELAATLQNPPVKRRSNHTPAAESTAVTAGFPYSFPPSLFSAFTSIPYFLHSSLPAVPHPLRFKIIILNASSVHTANTLQTNLTFYHFTHLVSV